MLTDLSLATCVKGDCCIAFVGKADADRGNTGGIETNSSSLGVQSGVALVVLGSDVESRYANRPAPSWAHPCHVTRTGSVPLERGTVKSLTVWIVVAGTDAR